MDYLKNKIGINRQIFILSIVSFFNDVASEMVYPILPIFLTSVLGTPMPLVGLIEGIADSGTSFLRAFFGALSDKLEKRKPFIIAGYGIAAIAHLFYISATSWASVLIGKICNRLGKGVRTSARDAMIAENSLSENRGKVFGFHRMMDTMGGVVGPLLAIFLLYALDNNYKMIFAIAFVLPLIALIVLIFLVKESSGPREIIAKIHISFKDMNPAFIFFVIATGIFAIGNSSDAFLVLKSKELGLSTIMTIFAYSTFSIFYAGFSLPAGYIADKLGPRRVILSGFLLFAIVYIGFGYAPSVNWVWILFPLYGLFMALTEGVGKAYISNLVAKEHLATAFGIQQMVVGIFTFLASLIAGVLWSNVGSFAPFVFGGAMAILAFIFFAFSPYFKKRGQIQNV